LEASLFWQEYEIFKVTCNGRIALARGPLTLDEVIRLKQAGVSDLDDRAADQARWQFAIGGNVENQRWLDCAHHGIPRSHPVSGRSKLLELRKPISAFCLSQRFRALEIRPSAVS
jgi:hypothetical protein